MQYPGQLIHQHLGGLFAGQPWLFTERRMLWTICRKGFRLTAWLAHIVFFIAPKGTMGLVFVKRGNTPTHPSHPPALAVPDQSQPRPHSLHAGRFETTAANLCALTSIMSILTQGRQRQLRLRSSRSHLAFHLSVLQICFLFSCQADTTPSPRKLVRRARAGAESLASKFGQVELEIKEEAGFKRGGLGQIPFGSLQSIISYHF